MLRQKNKNKIETKLKLIGFNPTIVSTTVSLKNSLPFAFRMIYFHLQFH